LFEKNKDRLTMTIPEVAKILGISRGLGYELAKRDALPIKVLKLGNRRMVVSRRAIEDLLLGQKNIITDDDFKIQNK
jgi:predicted DNA-binding transcriptional regulator AlpA